MVTKERIENAIEDINSLLMEFGEAVDSLCKTRELLYALIENEYKSAETKNAVLNR